MKEETHSRDFYDTLTEEEKGRNYLAVELDFIIGGKADLLLEFLDYMDFETRTPSLTLRHAVDNLREELGLKRPWALAKKP